MHRAFCTLAGVATALAATLLMASSILGCSIEDGEPSGPIPTPDAGVARTNVKLGETCSIPSECESKQCFIGGQSTYCSLSCGTDNAKTVCVPPAFNGVCNKQGFCRKP